MLGIIILHVLKTNFFHSVISNIDNSNTDEKRKKIKKFLIFIYFQKSRRKIKYYKLLKNNLI
jgi:hypothetical protein